MRVALSHLPLVEFVPWLGSSARGLAVDLPIHIAIDICHSRPFSFRFAQHRRSLAGRRFEGDDLRRGISQAEIDPSRVIGYNMSRVLRPGLLVDVAVILECL